MRVVSLYLPIYTSICCSVFSFVYSQHCSQFLSWNTKEKFWIRKVFAFPPAVDTIQPAESKGYTEQPQGGIFGQFYNPGIRVIESQVLCVSKIFTMYPLHFLVTLSFLHSHRISHRHEIVIHGRLNNFF